ncbi:hypothetical protein SAMN05444161_7944 [Rhizobiales bacterium GAS191]|nr:hypothetical protein SAMN05519104_3553 [Rhizobiales bacterium GAS188]SEE93434.1 hypothetical protein SAMN05444161_7944 [Rhizobiales bacterium GAS191]
MTSNVSPFLQGAAAAQNASTPRASAPQGFVQRVLVAVRSLLRQAPASSSRPLARIRARHAALGFPYRNNPGPAPKRPERDCDCVPW